MTTNTNLTRSIEASSNRENKLIKAIKVAIETTAVKDQRGRHVRNGDGEDKTPMSAFNSNRANGLHSNIGSKTWILILETHAKVMEERKKEMR